MKCSPTTSKQKRCRFFSLSSYSLLVFCSILVDERESIGSDLSNTDHSSPNGVLDPPILWLPSKPITTSALISQGRADPCLNIAYVPWKVLTFNPAKLELLQRTCEPIHAVIDFLHTVMECCIFPWLEPLEGLALCHKGPCGLRPVIGKKKLKSHVG